MPLTEPTPTASTPPGPPVAPTLEAVPAPRVTVEPPQITHAIQYASPAGEAKPASATVSKAAFAAAMGPGEQPVTPSPIPGAMAVPDQTTAMPASAAGTATVVSADIDDEQELSELITTEDTSPLPVLDPPPERTYDGFRNYTALQRLFPWLSPLRPLFRKLRPFMIVAVIGAVLYWFWPQISSKVLELSQNLLNQFFPAPK